jgi:hypothetical protein
MIPYGNILRSRVESHHRARHNLASQTELRLEIIGGILTVGGRFHGRFGLEGIAPRMPGIPAPESMTGGDMITTLANALHLVMNKGDIGDSLDPYRRITR